MATPPEAGGPRRGPLRRILAGLGPSAAASALAAAICGSIEAIPQTTSGVDALAATGFLGFVLLPVGMIVSLLARALVAAWRPAARTAALVEAGGGAPRLAAWALVLLVDAALLALLVNRGMFAIMSRTQTPIVHLVAAPIVAVVAAVVLAALAGPAVDAAAAGLRRLDRAAARRGRSWLRPRRVAAAAIVVPPLGGWVAWRAWLAPRLGELDLGFVPALVVWLAVLLAAPAALARAGRRRRRVGRAIAALAVGVAIAPLAAAAWVRAARPVTMLALWGDTRMAGFAIDLVYDVEAVRGELDLAEVAPASRPGAPHHDVVLITIDTTRADLTPPYGGNATMPRLAGLAAGAVVLEWAFSPGNVTRRSLPAIATGRSAPRVLGRVAGWALRIDPRHVMLAERFAAAGYETMGFFCCESQFGARHRLGLDRGIDRVEIEKDGGALASRVARALEGRTSTAPLFLWVHFLEPHNWEQDHPPQGAMRTPRDRYLASLAEVDRHLGVVLEAAWPPARRARTIVAVTADHGESLGEHGSRTHAKTLFNSEVHVPLVVAAPGLRHGRVARPVGLVDLAPTLLELAGFEPPTMPDMDGRSFASVLRGQGGAGLEDGAAYVVQLADRSVARTLRAVVVGRHKLVVDGDGAVVGLYDYVADRAEKRDLAAARPDLVRSLAAELARRREVDRLTPGAR